MNDTARDKIRWCHLVKDAHDERGVVMKPMPLAREQACRDACRRRHGGRERVSVVARSYFRAGHAVAAASDPAGQIGVVTGVATALDLARFDREQQAVTVARGVSPADLRLVTELSLGDYVVASGPWLGRVVEVSVNVDVLFDDGALCRLTRAEHKLKTADKNYLIRYPPNSVFYPGQRVAGRPPSVFKASRWIKLKATGSPLASGAPSPK
ncbi:hypothetical protein C2845_PM01G32390 [Panicum miliaceum]|uniref:UBE2O-like tandem tSH3-B domain-containing protein n=1 Tax=Panicum miliaceum TaxID=4540 RepID=A0A3L6TP68_PANMI|nr:hypothetical protein C2845_PM01G32390 [Panicum miliaceum]